MESNAEWTKTCQYYIEGGLPFRDNFETEVSFGNILKEVMSMKTKRTTLLQMFYKFMSHYKFIFKSINGPDDNHQGDLLKRIWVKHSFGVFLQTEQQPATWKLLRLNGQSGCHGCVTANLIYHCLL